MIVVAACCVARAVRLSRIKIFFAILLYREHGLVIRSPRKAPQDQVRRASAVLDPGALSLSVLVEEGNKTSAGQEGNKTSAGQEGNKTSVGQEGNKTSFGNKTSAEQEASRSKPGKYLQWCVPKAVHGKGGPKQRHGKGKGLYKCHGDWYGKIKGGNCHPSCVKGLKCVGGSAKDKKDGKDMGYNAGHCKPSNGTGIINKTSAGQEANKTSAGQEGNKTSAEQEANKTSGPPTVLVRNLSADEKRLWRTDMGVVSPHLKHDMKASAERIYVVRINMLSTTELPELININSYVKLVGVATSSSMSSSGCNELGGNVVTMSWRGEWEWHWVGIATSRVGIAKWQRVPLRTGQTFPRIMYSPHRKRKSMKDEEHRMRKRGYYESQQGGQAVMGRPSWTCPMTASTQCVEAVNILSAESSWNSPGRGASLHEAKEDRRRDPSTAQILDRARLRARRV